MQGAEVDALGEKASRATESRGAPYYCELYFQGVPLDSPSEWRKIPSGFWQERRGKEQFETCPIILFLTRRILRGN